MNPNQPSQLPSPTPMPQQPSIPSASSEANRMDEGIVLNNIPTQSVAPVVLTSNTTVGGLTIDSIETPQQRGRKKLTKIIVGISAILLLGVAGTGAAFYLSTLPLKSDYTAAQQVQNEIGVAGMALGEQPQGDVMSFTSSEYEALSASRQAKFKELDERIASFKDLKAMKNDEVNVAYESFNAKYNHAKTVLLQLDKSLPLIGNMKTQCGVMAGSAAQSKLRSASTVSQVQMVFNEITQPCMDAANGLKGSEVSFMVDYGASVGAALVALRLDIKQLSEARTVAAQTVAQAAMASDQEKIVAAGDVVEAEVAKLASEVSLSAEVEAFKVAVEKGKSNALI